MFLTFGTTPQSDSADPEVQQQQNQAPSRPKTKRAQVAQACDWCRVHRTKCDSSRPCQNCVLRGGLCKNTRSGEVRTLPHAFREIQRLTARVHELEAELAGQNAGSTSSRSSSGSSAASGGSVSAESPVTATTTPPSIAHRPSYSSDLERPGHGTRQPGGNNPPRRLWEGVYASTTQGSPKQWYGPSSLFYFIGRMETHMTQALQQPSTGRTLWFNSASKSLPSPASMPDREAAVARDSKDGDTQGRGQSPNGTPGEYLNASQEEFFLNLFWQSHHCALQIIDEATFREHYRSLCLDPPPGSFRKPSALVDIMVALCMQYGVAFLPQRAPAMASGGENNDVGADDGTLAGWWHYQRCRAILESEVERPTVSTLQSLLFCVVYICCASFQNTAHHLLAMAVRVGYTLGLHLEPPETMPWSERELRKRLWWTLFVNESKTCMKLGRPWSTAEAPTPCSLPADDHELALRSGSQTASITVGGSTVTWLTYTLQTVKLVLATRAVYAAFFDRCAEILGTMKSPWTLYDDPAALDMAADALEGFLDGPGALRAWLRDLPAALKTQRVGGGVPLSADSSRLDIEIFAPVWLQRQRLLLELLYHNFMINLHRPFIAFPATSLPGSESSVGRSPDATPALVPGPLATAHALTAARHGIAITTVIHQTVVEKDLLAGWLEAFQQQWNAAITMVGFLLAFPGSPVAPHVRTALATAIEVFEEFGKHFAVGSSAANATRDLLSKIDLLRGAGIMGEQQPVPQFQATAGAGQGAVMGQLSGMGAEAQTAAFIPAAAIATNSTSSAGPDYSQPSAFIPDISDEEMAAAVRDMLAGTIDMVYSADSFPSMGGPFPGGAQMGWEGWPPGFY
ncbi:fungal-specific transcription factor domain-containing protein [Chaetomium fimeti]|uniref:Fungal-specific transcription factor domain-containing protein n=1 Tax=Chaetomium fimeti TaxID=1854472 RepID=A0AAE0HPJ4_9PEZI|nr:fungal-specific transcription factor domain-containing protein [Chaetomium fimeti]